MKHSTDNIDILVEEPPLVRRNKDGRWKTLVDRIAEEHIGEWVRLMTTFDSSKEARAERQGQRLGAGAR